MVVFSVFFLFFFLFQSKLLVLLGTADLKCETGAILCLCFNNSASSSKRYNHCRMMLRERHFCERISFSPCPKCLHILAAHQVQLSSLATTSPAKITKRRKENENNNNKENRKKERETKIDRPRGGMKQQREGHKINSARNIKMRPSWPNRRVPRSL